MAIERLRYGARHLCYCVEQLGVLVVCVCVCVYMRVCVRVCLRKDVNGAVGAGALRGHLGTQEFIIATVTVDRQIELLSVPPEL